MSCGTLNLDYRSDYQPFSLSVSAQQYCASTGSLGLSDGYVGSCMLIGPDLENRTFPWTRGLNVAFIDDLISTALFFKHRLSGAKSILFSPINPSIWRNEDAGGQCGYAAASPSRQRQAYPFLLDVVWYFESDYRSDYQSLSLLSQCSAMFDQAALRQGHPDSLMHMWIPLRSLVLT